MVKEELTQPCPCHSGLLYKNCCAPLHRGDNPEDAVALMRSRYSAYGLSLADYIMHTTHPMHPNPKPPPLWQQEILRFCNETQFLGLEILEFEQVQGESSVTFTAVLRRNGQNCSFTEKSQFLKHEGRWLYVKALFLKPA